jgi:hypothetical protein
MNTREIAEEMQTHYQTDPEGRIAGYLIVKLAYEVDTLRRMLVTQQLEINKLRREVDHANKIEYLSGRNA